MATKNLLRLEGISKQFPGVRALDRVDLDLHEGEVHVLLGENGAGKSTLMKIILGSLPRDGGRIYIQDREVNELTPRRAQELGIGMVHQELSLIPALSVAENILINRLPRKRGLIDWPRANELAAESLDNLGVSIDPRLKARELSVSEQQLVEIARVLARDCRILLLDEPTSALTETETERLFEIIRRLQSAGVGIIYISHRLHEVPLIGGRVTVMRDGKIIATLPVAEVDRESLIRMMIGNRLVDQYPKREVEQGELVLKVEGLSAADKLHGLSFALRRGEILGIFGRMGAGQTELAQALFGLLPRTSGRIHLGGEEVTITSPADAIARGMAFLTRDRRSSLVPMQPIPVNVTLATTGQAALLKPLNVREERRLSETYVKGLKIRPPLLDRPVVFLSGGNQQKVLLARWMYSGARILIFDEPTRGIDVGAKAEVFALISRLAQGGAGIILISSELSEILAMSDRILVMKDGALSASYRRSEATQERLLHDAS